MPCLMSSKSVLNNWLKGFNTGCVSLGIILFSFFSATASADYCFEQWACVEIIEQQNHVEFWIFNNKPYPFTATLAVSTVNLGKPNRRQNQFQKTLVLQDSERKMALRLEVLNPSRKFHYNDSFYWTPGDMNAKHDGSLYQFPYQKGQKYRIVQGFGGRYSHSGASRYAVDFAMPEGTPIHAARQGQVIDLTEHNYKGGASRRFAKYANFITILHQDGTLGEYYHLQHNGAEVSVGDYVHAGQLIGYSGNTGFSSLPHLHFARLPGKELR